MRLPRFRLTVRRLLIVLTIVAISTLIILWKPFLISFHERKMHSAWRTVERIGASDRRQGDWIRRMESHRDALVSLGHLERRVILLRQIKASSKEIRPLFLALNQRSDGLPYFAIQGWGSVPDSVIVWSKPTEMEAWKSIVEKYDQSLPGTP